MKGTVSGFTPSRGPNPDSIQVARAGTPVVENSSNGAQNVCLGTFFLESASIFPISCHTKVILKKRRILSGISQVDGTLISEAEVLPPKLPYIYEGLNRAFQRFSETEVRRTRRST